MKLLAPLSIPAIITIVVIVVVVLSLVIWMIATYNSLVVSRNATDVASSDMDVYLKKRYDLIPNLVETVKGYAKHESEVLTAVTNARANAKAASTLEEKVAADVEVTRALRSINLVAEKYPDLKADTSFLKLQSTLSSVEEDIANSRRYFNAKVGSYNAKILKFPTNLLANLFKFKSRPLYQVDDPEERKTVKVSF